MKILTERVSSFSAAADREIVRNIMEKTLLHFLDYDTELKSTAEFDEKKTQCLPDSKHHHCRSESFL